jgi:hypothetical protein
MKDCLAPEPLKGCFIDSLGECGTWAGKEEDTEGSYNCFHTGKASKFGIPELARPSRAFCPYSHPVFNVMKMSHDRHTAVARPD